MPKPYVHRDERVLFGLSLAFSILIYILLAAGAVGGCVALKHASAAQKEFMESLPDDSGDSGGDWDDDDDSGEDNDSDGDGSGKDDSSGKSLKTSLEARAPAAYRATTVAYGAGADSGFDEGYYENEAAGLATTGIGVVFGVVLFYLALIVAFYVALRVLAIGRLMGNGVRVNERQFPELWTLFNEAAAELEVKKLPAFYVVESGGALNAYAARLFLRNYVAINADLAERLYEGDADAVAFVVAHELVHVRRGHAFKNLITLPAEMVPFLKGAWRRSCEYSCDAGAYEWRPAGAERGLLLLAAGKKMSERMSADEYLAAFDAERSAWKRLAELFASHPHLPKRIKLLRRRASGLL